MFKVEIEYIDGSYILNQYDNIADACLDYNFELLSKQIKKMKSVKLSENENILKIWERNE